MTTLITRSNSKSDFKQAIPDYINHEKEKSGNQPKTKKKAFSIRDVKVSYMNTIQVLAMKVILSPKSLLSRLIRICPVIKHDVFKYIEKKITKGTETMTHKINQSRDKLVELAKQDQDLTLEELEEANRLFTEELKLIGERHAATSHLDKIKK